MMNIQLVPLHYVYLAFIVLIIAVMVRRKDTTIICVAGIMTIGLLAAETLSGSVAGIFNSFIYAAKELLSTIFIISIIVAMSRVLIRTGINEVMVRPLTRFIRTPQAAYWSIGLIMMVVSLFFWPSPAVALVGAVLLPAAVRVGLPPIGAAIAMNLFGHGIALSGDYIIQGAPKLTADAAGLPVASVMAASVPLVLVMGTVSTLTAFWMLRKEMKSSNAQQQTVKLEQPSTELPVAPESHSSIEVHTMPLHLRKAFALIVPLLFALDVVLMFVLSLQGGDATALIGGTAVVILIAVSMAAHRYNGSEETTHYLIEGFQFGFKVFGPVIPIAAFFYLGDAAITELFANPLPEGSHGIVNDLGVALAGIVPMNGTVGAITMTVTGAVTGMDGSGFSGISLVGSIATMFAGSADSAPMLTALGQIAAIWVGGGTLIPWALIPAAAICGVSPFELARRNLKPVIIGLTVTTIVGIFLI
ncbi:membrane protein [Paenibacillus silvae]|uniref:Membrane protein n=2 Tax=Paenibacillus silvae TaxID=1325358 RepID=A0ABQ1ZF82_9BACL|nr:membrane protein [Paenibacillus silvae]